LAADSAWLGRSRGTIAFETGEKDALPAPSKKLTATAVGTVRIAASRAAAPARKRSRATRSRRGATRSTISWASRPPAMSPMPSAKTVPATARTLRVIPKTRRGSAVKLIVSPARLMMAAIHRRR